MRSEALICLTFWAVSALCPQTATAQDKCGEIWNAVGSLVPVAMTVGSGPETTADGGCVMNGLRIGGQGQYAVLVTMDSVSWKASPPDPIMAEPLGFPETLDLNIEGLRIGVAVDDPVWNYLMEAQRQLAGIHVHIAARWSPDRQTLDLDDLKIDFPGDNMVSATAAFATFDPASFGTTARLTALDLSVLSAGLFETYLLMPLGQALLAGSTDPAADVAAMKAQAISEVAAIPILEAEGKAALTSLIEDMPNPTGTLGFSLSSQDGIGLTSLTPFVTGVPPTWPAVLRLVDGSNLTISYAPIADAPG